MWQPVEPVDGVRRQHGTGRHFFQPLLINRAAAGFLIHIPAHQIGVIDVTGIFILQLGHAAFAAAITEGFPLAGGHFFQALALPEGYLCHH
jgi:hypothetical protein